MFEAMAAIERALSELDTLGFRGDDRSTFNNHSSVAYEHLTDMLFAGEELLLLHKRLALSDAAYGFLHSNQLPENWDRYKDTTRAARKIDQAVADTRELVLGYYAMLKEDSDLLTRNLELPPELAADFYLARNLFSVGFDQVGVLIAGRGLERVLRRIAARHKIMIDSSRGAEPAAESDLHDLIESMYRIRWKVRDTRVISAQTRGLLHFLRTVRNSYAHESTNESLPGSSTRETATILARTANALWTVVTGTKARLASTRITKNW